MKWDKFVKDLRKSLFFSQEEMAKELKIAFCSINRYENNKTTPTFKVQKRIIELSRKNKFDYKKYED